MSLRIVLIYMMMNTVCFITPFKLLAHYLNFDLDLYQVNQKRVYRIVMDLCWDNSVMEKCFPSALVSNSKKFRDLLIKKI